VDAAKTIVAALPILSRQADGLALVLDRLDHNGIAMGTLRPPKTGRPAGEHIMEAPLRGEGRRLPALRAKNVFVPTADEALRSNRCLLDAQGAERWRRQFIAADSCSSPPRN